LQYPEGQKPGFLRLPPLTAKNSYAGRRRNFVGQSFWARGYCRDEGIVKKYIKRQDEFEQRNEQLELF